MTSLCGRSFTRPVVSLVLVLLRVTSKTARPSSKGTSSLLVNLRQSWSSQITSITPRKSLSCHLNTHTHTHTHTHRFMNAKPLSFVNSDAFWVHKCKCTHISAHFQMLEAEYICLWIQHVWHSICLCLYIFLYIYEMCMWPSPAGLYFLKSIQYVCVCVFPPVGPVTTLNTCICVLRHTHTHTFTQLPPFPQTALQAAELLVSLVEELELTASPAPPDSQAPGHVFFTEAAHNGVLCDERRLRQSPERRTRGRK